MCSRYGATKNVNFQFSSSSVVEKIVDVGSWHAIGFEAQLNPSERCKEKFQNSKHVFDQLEEKMQAT